VQYYEGKALDASLLMIPLVGFLPLVQGATPEAARVIEMESINKQGSTAS
jgi:hypothetical protein